MAHPDDSDYARAIRASNSAPAGRGFIVMDTFGTLRAHGAGLWGSCLDCGGAYWPSVRARITPPPSSFNIDLDALIAQRGPDCRVVGLKPVPCPRCGSLDTRALFRREYLRRQS